MARENAAQAYTKPLPAKIVHEEANRAKYRSDPIRAAQGLYYL